LSYNFQPVFQASWWSVAEFAVRDLVHLAEWMFNRKRI